MDSSRLCCCSCRIHDPPMPYVFTSRGRASKETKSHIVDCEGHSMSNPKAACTSHNLHGENSRQARLKGMSGMLIHNHKSPTRLHSSAAPWPMLRLVVSGSNRLLSDSGFSTCSEEAQELRGFSSQSTTLRGGHASRGRVSG